MRELVLRDIANDIRNRFNYPYRKIGDLLGVGKSTIYRWIKYKSKLKSETKSFVVWDKVISNFVRNNPHCRLKDIQIHLKTNYFRTFSLSTICRYLRKLNLSYKRIKFQQYTNLSDLEEKKRQFESNIK